VTLAKRLLAGSLVLVLVLVVGVVAIAGGRLRNRLADETRRELEREARLVATEWRAGINADSLANVAGTALGRRVTLIDSTGVVRGDSEFDGEDLLHLQNHSTRPEVVEAKANGVGSSMRSSASAGDDEMYLAIRHPLGTVRVSVTTTKFREIVSGAQRDVVVAGIIALVGALFIGWAFSRSVSRPIIELRDVAQAIAAGELDRRPTLSAPGEVGDLAAALHRMTEQLAARMSALESDDALLNAVFESLDEAIVAISPRRDVVRLNQSARRLLSLDATVPFSVDLLPRERSVREAVRGAMAGHPTEATELSLGDRTLLITARPLPDGGAVLALMDLTTRRRLETIRRDFVANVSHELKTPLTVIGGFAETLRDGDLSAADRIEHAADAAHRRRPPRSVALRIRKLGAERRSERSCRRRQRCLHERATRGRRKRSCTDIFSAARSPARRRRSHRIASSAWQLGGERCAAYVARWNHGARGSSVERWHHTRGC